MIKQMLENVRNTTPLVHNITNYVTVNDCANILLACGASPIMADDISEVEEIVSICNSLVINLGTLNDRTIKAMLLAGKKANLQKHPVVLDPVGIGASKLRTDTTKMLLREVKFSVIRGNISEIKLVNQAMLDIMMEDIDQLRNISKDSNEEFDKESRGVDASAADCVTEHNLEATVAYAKQLSKLTKAVIVITGAIDIIADLEQAFIIRNGHPMMGRITGSGCMLTSILGAYCAANSGEMTSACVAAVCAMGLCGERAFEKVSSEEAGTGSFRTYLIDYMSRLDGEQLESGAKVQKA